MIRAIAAIDDKRGIARDGGIPWNIPEDGRYFRNQTSAGLVVMGWATYLEFAEPLPNRRNVVVSYTDKPIRDGFELITDVVAFLRDTTEDVWIIGGAGLYASTLMFCDELYLTHVQGDYRCDRFFPEYESLFKLASQSPAHHDGAYTYRFAVYNKS